MNFIFCVFVSGRKSPVYFMFKFNGRLADLFYLVSTIFDSSSIERVEIFDSSREVFFGSVSRGSISYE